MPTIEERVAYLEGRVSEQSHVLIEIRDAIRHLEGRFDARFEGHDQRFGSIDARFDGLERSIDARFDGLARSVDARFEAIDRRFDAIDRRFDIIDRRFEATDRRIDGLDDKVSRQFVWLVGIQVTTLVAIVGALLTRS